LPIYPIVFRHHRLPVAGKHSILQPRRKTKQKTNWVRDPQKPPQQSKDIYEQEILKHGDIKAP